MLNTIWIDSFFLFLAVLAEKRRESAWLYETTQSFLQNRTYFDQQAHLLHRTTSKIVA